MSSTSGWKIKKKREDGILHECQYAQVNKHKALFIDPHWLSMSLIYEYFVFHTSHKQ